jgi:hypothetical protein
MDDKTMRLLSFPRLGKVTLDVNLALELDLRNEFPIVFSFGARKMGWLCMDLDWGGCLVLEFVLVWFIVLVFDSAFVSDVCVLL